MSDQWQVFFETDDDDREDSYAAADDPIEALKTVFETMQKEEVVYVRLERNGKTALSNGELNRLFGPIES